MAAPVVKKKGRLDNQPVTLLTSDVCPICSPHLISDHDELKARSCSKCGCIAQDVNTGR